MGKRGFENEDAICEAGFRQAGTAFNHHGQAYRLGRCFLSSSAQHSRKPVLRRSGAAGAAALADTDVQPEPSPPHHQPRPCRCNSRHSGRPFCPIPHPAELACTQSAGGWLVLGRPDNHFVHCDLRRLHVDLPQAAVEEVVMMRLIVALAVGFAAFASSGCQATSTAGAYQPANCAMVGSRCSRS